MLISDKSGSQKHVFLIIRTTERKIKIISASSSFQYSYLINNNKCLLLILVCFKKTYNSFPTTHRTTINSLI